MKRPTNLKAGDQFRVIGEFSHYEIGEIISLQRDDGSNCPYFQNENKSNSHYIYFSNLEPFIKSIRDVQVGDVVVNKIDGSEKMVLERGQNTVDLSYPDNFKVAGNNYTFDELEEYYTLKDAPEVELVDETAITTAEAIKLVEEAGYNVEKKNASKAENDSSYIRHTGEITGHTGKLIEVFIENESPVPEKNEDVSEK